QAGFDALAPGPADILEVHSRGAGRGYGEDVVEDLRPVRAQLSAEPGERAHAHPDLVVGGAHRVQGRIRRGPRLQPRADRRRSGAGQLQEARSAESLRPGEVDSVVARQVVVEADERVDAPERGGAARVLPSGPLRA